MDKRKNLMLAVLAAAGGDAYTPVQIQKLLFLLDRTVPTGLGGGPSFNFKPYHYGPFDPNVYAVVEELENEGLAEISPAGSVRTFSATAAGLELGEKALSALPESLREYIVNLSKWIRSLSFSDLISSIYTKYPEMKANSVFQR